MNNDNLKFAWGLNCLAGYATADKYGIQVQRYVFDDD